MSDGIYSAASGALARMQQLDVIANNLANASSAGFRAQGVAFREVLDTAGGNELRQAATDGTSVKDSQGALTQTGRALDVAIDGRGYFTLQGPDGPLLTRNGHFTIDAGGALVNAEGLPVLGSGGPIRLDPTAQVTFSEHGDVIANGEVVSSLTIATYDARDLRSVGGSLLGTTPDGKELPRDQAMRVRGQSLESSNTSVLGQITEMITTNRLFDATMNAIDTYKQIDSKTAAGLSRR